MCRHVINTEDVFSHSLRVGWKRLFVKTLQAAFFWSELMKRFFISNWCISLQPLFLQEEVSWNRSVVLTCRASSYFKHWDAFRRHSCVHFTLLWLWLCLLAVFWKVVVLFPRGGKTMLFQFSLIIQNAGCKGVNRAKKGIESAVKATKFRRRVSPGAQRDLHL